MYCIRTADSPFRRLPERGEVLRLDNPDWLPIERDARSRFNAGLKILLAVFLGAMSPLKAASFTEQIADTPSQNGSSSPAGLSSANGQDTNPIIFAVTPTPSPVLPT